MVTPAAVSRSIARLEERLGVRLFVRTTRQIRLTDGGRRYYQQCREALGVATLARVGAGLVQTYRYIVERDLADGSLVELLPQHGGTSRPFILLYPHARHLSLRVRTFVDFLTTRLSQRRWPAKA